MHHRETSSEPKMAVHSSGVSFSKIVSSYGGGSDGKDRPIKNKTNFKQEIYNYSHGCQSV